MLAAIMLAFKEVREILIFFKNPGGVDTVFSLFVENNKMWQKKDCRGKRAQSPCLSCLGCVPFSL